MYEERRVNPMPPTLFFRCGLPTAPAHWKLGYPR